jgi:hypothetical protein
MAGSRPHPCYLCGKPCWNKGCAECLHKGKWGGLAKFNSRRKKRKESNDVSFVVSKDI